MKSVVTIYLETRAREIDRVGVIENISHQKLIGIKEREREKERERVCY